VLTASHAVSQDKEPAGTIELQQARQILVVNDYVRKKRVECMFQIKLPLRTYLIIAPDDATRLAWVQAIDRKLAGNAGANKGAATTGAGGAAPAGGSAWTDEEIDDIAAALGRELRGGAPAPATTNTGRAAGRTVAAAGGAPPPPTPPATLGPAAASKAPGPAATSAQPQPPPPPKSTERLAKAERVAANLALALAEQQENDESSDDDNNDVEESGTVAVVARPGGRRRPAVRPPPAVPVAPELDVQILLPVRSPPLSVATAGAAVGATSYASATEAARTAAAALNDELVHDVVMAAEDLVREPLADVARSLKPLDAVVMTLIGKGYGYAATLPTAARLDAALVCCAEVEGALSATMAVGTATAAAAAAAPSARGDLPTLRKLLAERVRQLILGLRRFNDEFGAVPGARGVVNHNPVGALALSIHALTLAVGA
jgi:hypothetical protein